MADEIVYVTVTADVVETVDVAAFVPEPIVVDVLVNEIFDGFSYVQDTEPLTPINGQTWYNPTTGQSKVWHLTEWLTFPEVGLPSGTIIQGGWLVAPFGCAFLNGQTLVDGALNYPTIAVQYPSWVSGNDLVLPNVAGFTLIATNGTAGATPITSNSKTVTITSNNLPLHTHADTLAAPAHTHSINPPNTTTSSDSHTHTTSSLKYGAVTNYGFTIASGGLGPTANGNHASSSDDHTHTVDIASFTSGPESATALTGSVGNNTTTATALPYNTTPAHMLVKFAVKL